MICKVKKTIQKYNMLENVKSVAVGVSGGADSMCLLNILSSLKEEYGIILKVVHLNHNLRGEEALADEMLVRNYCEKNGIECIVFSEDIRTLAKTYGISEEECGRKVRYDCFEKANCDAVAVAHSFSDSIETFTFNLLRGTGSKGLCGIPPKREPNIIRPLIECTRQEVEKYCTENKLQYATDSTNLSDDYTRNFIRHQIVPNFAKVNSGYEKSFANLMNIMSEENDFIDLAVKSLLNEIVLNKGYDAEKLCSAHSAVRKRAISEILKKHMDKTVCAKHALLVDSIVTAKKGKIQISKGLYIVVDSGIMSVHTQQKQTGVMSEVVFKNGKAENVFGKFTAEEISFNKANENYLNCFDMDKIKGELVLSFRKPHDEFTLKKRKVTKSLKKLFNELKIPKEKRETIAVIRDSKNIVFVEGIGVNAPYMPSEETKKYAVIKKEE